MDSAGRRPFVCIGTAIVDCIVRRARPDLVSLAGFTAEMTELAPGGEAVNQAVALSRLDGPVRLVCFAGQDAAGEFLLQNLRKHLIDLSFVIRPEKIPTPVSVLFLDEAGDRKSVTSQAHFYNFHPENNLTFLDQAEGIVLGSLFRTPFNDPEPLRRILCEAEERGVPVYADTKLPKDGNQSLENYRDVLKKIDCIFPNEREAAWYTDRKEPEAMADVFLEYGVKRVAIKLGEKGCLYKSSSETIRLDGIRVSAVDATGAGDNFLAGYLTMHREGKAEAEAVRFANVCGALSTAFPGASGNLYSRAEAEDLYEKEYGKRI